MLKAYTLRSEYEGTLSGGTIHTGVNGESMDIVQALADGNGEIITDDLALQSILSNYYGEFGLVFKAAEVDGDERTPIEQEEVLPGTQAGEILPAAAGHAALPDAQHDDQSGYNVLTVDELKSTLSERDVQFNSRATKQELIEALETDDRARIEGANSGS